MPTANTFSTTGLNPKVKAATRNNSVMNFMRLLRDLQQCGFGILLFVVIFAGITHAQPEIRFFNQYGNRLGVDTCHDHIQTSDGGFALVGGSQSGIDYRPDILIIKTDENGDSLWARYWGWVHPEYDSTADAGLEIIERDDDFLIFGSFRWNNEDRDLFSKIGVISMDKENGDSLWARIYDCGDYTYLHNAIQTNDGGFAVTGYAEVGEQNYHQGDDFFLLRLDEECDSLWMRTYGMRGIEQCQEVIQTHDGGFVLAGYTNSLRGDYSVLLIFSDENGDSLSCYSTETDDMDWYDYKCYAIEEVYSTVQEEYIYILSGYKYRPGFADALTLAITREGEVLWQRIDGIDEGYMGEVLFSSCLTSNNNIVLSGRFTDKLGIYKINFSGDMIYERYWELDQWDLTDFECSSLLQTDNYELSLAGFCWKDTVVNNRSRYYHNYFLLNTEPEYFDNVESDDANPHIPTSCVLYPAYPNPFNSQTTIQFGLLPGVKGSLRIFDPQGRLVTQSLVNGSTTQQQFSWDAHGLPNGEYFIHLNSGDRISTQQILLLK